jgi:hypothetical protein
MQEPEQRQPVRLERWRACHSIAPTTGFWSLIPSRFQVDPRESWGKSRFRRLATEQTLAFKRLFKTSVRRNDSDSARISDQDRRWDLRGALFA